jgi:DNA-binding XRE family transcriptional regulator
LLCAGVYFYSAAVAETGIAKPAINLLLFILKVLGVTLENIFTSGTALFICQLLLQQF